MSSIDTFQRRKATLLDLYDRIAESAHLPVTAEGMTIDRSDVANGRQRLSEERFVVSVCGQIKVGKSTFLNDLLFGEDVLPSADNPETAKLTEIVHGDVFEYEATLYTPEEYRTLCATEIVLEAVPTTYYAAYIKPEIDRYIARTGELLFPEQVLEHGSFKGTNIADLRTFVSKDGKYTPFVKAIKITHSSPLLRDVVFVDTPGTNDPNPFRSAVTERWMKHADAVIFLMYAGAAFDRQDEAFINQYLLPVPSERILLALSKIDNVSDAAGPRAYVEQALAAVPGFAQSLRHHAVHAIAPMFSLYPKLLASHQAGRVILSERRLGEIEFQLYERPGDFSALIASEGHMPAFRTAVETHLVAGKGEAVLASHSQKIRAVYAYIQRRVQMERGQAEQELSLFSLNDHELAEREVALRASKRKFDKLDETSRDQQQAVLLKFQDSLRAALVKVGQGLIADGRMLIESAASLDGLERNFAWDLKAAFERALTQDFQPAIQRCYDEAKETIGDHLEIIRGEALGVQVLQASHLDLLFGRFFVAEILREVSMAINNRFTEQFLYGKRVGKYMLWTNRAETGRAFEAALKEFFDQDGDFAKDVEKLTCERFAARLQRSFGEVFEQLQAHVQGASRTIEEIKAGRGDLAASRQRVSERLASLGERERDIVQELAEVDALLAVRVGEPLGV